MLSMYKTSKAKRKGIYLQEIYYNANNGWIIFPVNSHRSGIFLKDSPKTKSLLKKEK